MEAKAMTDDSTAAEIDRKDVNDEKAFSAMVAEVVEKCARANLVCPVGAAAASRWRPKPLRSMRLCCT